MRQQQPHPIIHSFLLLVLAICLAVDAALLCGMFGGCVTTTPPTRFEEDRQTCWGAGKVQAQWRATALGRINDPASEQKVFEACMAQRGWK